ncbi:LysR family transcriptional regulator [Rhodococcus sp. T2V]|uniref:LysR family transcriptional regulator n=1 Tax=Rhodococcus sp. T2V TaxID=3034164 RepID=UPI0023E10D04|nr:LysR family transcriptional regulator [Rhodococcus sp. T2V]MDF3312839.1 LysR family transcriptional regulator [Rhodococcus sp. T2V]
MLDLRQFQALRAIARTRSTAAAARELGWSQPTVTHHLRALAQATGAPVVRSTSAGTALTRAGALWLPHAQALLDRADRAHGEVQSALADGMRRCRIGVFPTAAAHLLPAIVKATADADVRVDVTEAENEALWSEFDALRLDAVITYEMRPGSRPGGTRLFEEHFGVLLPRTHALAERDRVTLRELRKETWILGRDQADAIDAMLQGFARDAGFTPIEGQHSDDYRVVAAYVAAGLGVAFVPELALPVSTDGCRFVPLSDRLPPRVVSLHTAAHLPEDIRDVLLDAVTREER